MTSPEVWHAEGHQRTAGWNPGYVGKSNGKHFSLSTSCRLFYAGIRRAAFEHGSRQQCLQQLWENSALPKDLYEHFYLQPLKQLVTLMQVLPAASQGSMPGRRAGRCYPADDDLCGSIGQGTHVAPGAAPEEQSAQNVQWNVVVFYAALWHYLPLLSQLQGEFQSGRTWLPGLTVPGEPYRFRFRAAPSAPTLATSQSAMIAARLLPEELIEWLSTLPAAIHSLMTIASRQPSTLPAIDDITLRRPN